MPSSVNKVSDITVADIAEYIRAGELNAAETKQLTTFFAIAKNYCSNYTGIAVNKYVETTDTEPNETKTYYFLESGNYVEFTGSAFIEGTTYYEKLYEEDMDDYPDFVIVIYILCQDMFDNRAMYVDSENPNKVVQTILDMHTRNNI